MFFLKKLRILTTSCSCCLLKEVIAMEPKRTEYSLDYFYFKDHLIYEIFAHLYP